LFEVNRNAQAYRWNFIPIPHIFFKREETFPWFVIILVGILIRPDLMGISSIVGCLSLDPRYYELMLHFFRSFAFDLRNIKSKWQDIVLAYVEPGEID